MGAPPPVRARLLRPLRALVERLRLPAWFSLPRRAPEHGPHPPGPWRQALLLLDPECGVPWAGLEVAFRLVSPGGVLHALVAVYLPRGIRPRPAAGPDARRAAELLEQVERLAAERGIAVVAHLRRGASPAAILREVAGQIGADVVVLAGRPELVSALARGRLRAQTVVVPLPGRRGT